MIVLKHLAREYDMNPSRMRRQLRERFGYHKRWQWREDDPELRQVREFLSSLRSKTSPPSSESSQETKSPSSSIFRRFDGSTLH